MLSPLFGYWALVTTGRVDILTIKRREDMTTLGISCPACSGQDLRTRETRRVAVGILGRYRVCRACGSTLRTRETVAGLVTPRPRRPNESERHKG
jgi:hypothetical protein